MQQLSDKFSPCQRATHFNKEAVSFAGSVKQEKIYLVNTLFHFVTTMPSFSTLPWMI
jgi:hypothetical protein